MVDAAKQTRHAVTALFAKKRPMTITGGTSTKQTFYRFNKQKEKKTEMTTFTVIDSSLIKDGDICTHHAVIAIVEAESEEEAKITAMRGISPDMKMMVDELKRNQPENFIKYVLDELKAIPKTNNK